MATSVEQTKAIWERINARNKELLDEASRVAEELLRQMRNKAERVHDYRELREQIEHLENRKLLSSELTGKNAELRKAEFDEILRQDGTWRAWRRQALDDEHDIAQMDANIEYLRNKLSILKLAARWNQAVAAAWGGPDDE